MKGGLLIFRNPGSLGNLRESLFMGSPYMGSPLDCPNQISRSVAGETSGS